MSTILLLVCCSVHLHIHWLCSHCVTSRCCATACCMEFLSFDESGTYLHEQFQNREFLIKISWFFAGWNKWKSVSNISTEDFLFFSHLECRNVAKVQFRCCVRVVKVFIQVFIYTDERHSEWNINVFDVLRTVYRFTQVKYKIILLPKFLQAIEVIITLFETHKHTISTILPCYTFQYAPNSYSDGVFIWYLCVLRIEYVKCTGNVKW